MHGELAADELPMIQQDQHIGVMIITASRMAAADLEIQVDDDDAYASPTDYDLPAISANTWTWATVDIPSMTSATEMENYQAVDALAIEPGHRPRRGILCLLAGWYSSHLIHPRIHRHAQPCAHQQDTTLWRQRNRAT